MTGKEPSINFGNISGGAFAFGSHGHAESNQHYGAAPQRDEATEQLLEAVRQLRADLERVNSTEQTVALGQALADTETEITSTGEAGPTRRQRLRELLTDSQALVTFLSSAGALAGLLGR
ncbi:hypothetical protein ACWCRD_11045 [Streptomyces sp. NPDC002092]